MLSHRVLAFCQKLCNRATIYHQPPTDKRVRQPQALPVPLASDERLPLPRRCQGGVGCGMDLLAWPCHVRNAGQAPPVVRRVLGIKAPTGLRPNVPPVRKPLGTPVYDALAVPSRYEKLEVSHDGVEVDECLCIKQLVGPQSNNQCSLSHIG